MGRPSPERAEPDSSRRSSSPGRRSSSFASSSSQTSCEQASCQRSSSTQTRTRSDDSRGSTTSPRLRRSASFPVEHPTLPDRCDTSGSDRIAHFSISRASLCRADRSTVRHRMASCLPGLPRRGLDRRCVGRNSSSTQPSKHTRGTARSPSARQRPSSSTVCSHDSVISKRLTTAANEDEVGLEEDEEAPPDQAERERWIDFLTWIGVNRVLRPVHFHDVEDRATGWLTTRDLGRPTAGRFGSSRRTYGTSSGKQR